MILQTIMVLHGPNLNLLGSREPKLYGSISLADVNSKLEAQANSHDIKLLCKQSNAEHELIGMVQAAPQDDISAIIVNAAGYAHTSIALRDAFLAVKIPFIEVHITNTAAREEFRGKSYLSDVAIGSIIGLGTLGYELALTALIAILNQSTKE